nr:Protein PERM-1 [Haemonchus contortus]
MLALSKRYCLQSDALSYICPLCFYNVHLVGQMSSKEKPILSNIWTNGHFGTIASPRDKCSVLTDLIKFASNGDIVSVGDSDGAFEMAYAGNLAEGLWNAALHLLSSVDIRKAAPHGTTPEVPAKSIKDTIILSDETPKKNIFPLFKPVLTTGKRNMIQCCIPFVPLFYIYYVVTLLVNVLSGYITMPMCIRKLPHPSVLYLCFRHWTFFNTKKSRLVLDYQPSIKFEDALNRCQMYYRHLQPQDIPSYSWSPNESLYKILSSAESSLRDLMEPQMVGTVIDPIAILNVMFGINNNWVMAPCPPRDIVLDFRKQLDRAEREGKEVQFKVVCRSEAVTQ